MLSKHIPLFLDGKNQCLITTVEVHLRNPQILGVP